MSEYVASLFAEVKAKNPAEPEFHQAVQEVTESLALHGMAPEVRKVCRLAGITNKSILLQVVRQGDPQKMLALVERLAGQGSNVTREQLRKDKEAQQPKSGRPKHYVFAFRPESKAFNLRLRFNRKAASKEDVITALEAILKELRQST